MQLAKTEAQCEYPNKLAREDEFFLWGQLRGLQGSPVGNWATLLSMEFVCFENLNFTTLYILWYLMLYAPHFVVSVYLMM